MCGMECTTDGGQRVLTEVRLSLVSQSSDTELLSLSPVIALRGGGRGTHDGRLKR